MSITQEKMSGAMESSGLKSSNFLLNNMTFIVAFGMFAGFMIGLILIIKCKHLFKEALREYMQAKFTMIKNKFLFNGKIKALTMSYLKLTIAFSA